MVDIRKSSRRFSVSLILYLLIIVALSTMAEALVRVAAREIFVTGNFIILILMSAAQVFLITGLFNISLFQKTIVLDEQQRASYEKMLIVASDLYDEFFFMQKSMDNMENIMAKSYTLHKRLKEMKISDRSLEHSALEIAEEVHEVKKDTVRILAGIGEVIKIRKEKPVMTLAEITDLVIKTNCSYAQSLEKKIKFNLEIEEDMEISQIYPLLAILNNLVSNAVEAIEPEGYIHLRARRKGRILRLSVCDNGLPIRESNRTLIFEPGFTTKFSAEGVPSTGIGLAYVRGLVENFRGRVFFRQDQTEKCFTVMLPVCSINGG
jgi:two-component system, sensor histidine kinase YcbA